jgi:hypothetical protein
MAGLWPLPNGGDPDGLPVIAMHGTPGGRITYWDDPTKRNDSREGWVGPAHRLTRGTG